MKPTRDIKVDVKHNHRRKDLKLSARTELLLSDVINFASAAGECSSDEAIDRLEKAEEALRRRLKGQEAELNTLRKKMSAIRKGKK
jgi:hypothetical protein